MIQSITFWLALPSAVLVYWLLPARSRMAFLASVSAVFVGWLDLHAAIALAAWTVLFFMVAPLARREVRFAGRAVPFLLIAVFAYLGYQKYLPGIVAALGFAEETRHILVPLGASYFTFKLAHYAIEVGRGTITDRNFASFACYMFLFPIYTAGPIERYDHFLKNRSDAWDSSHLLVGSTRIVKGLIKKLVIGEIIIRNLYGDFNSIAAVLDGLDRMSTIDAWRFVALSYLFAYMDFSGYSDIAIGASRLFGIRVMENFRWPILAANIGDFWKRWHMTLAGWCQSYVYMPTIALTRKPYLAIYATFVTMGVWHGGALTWVGWGLYHATGVSIYLTWGRIKRARDWMPPTTAPFRVAATFVTFIWVSGSYCFSTTLNSGIGQALRLLAKLIGIPS